MPRIDRWERLGRVAPAELAETRLQLHWAAQTVSAVARALLERRPDHSDGNLGWSHELAALLTHELPGGYHAGLRFPECELLLVDRSSNVLRHWSLDGRTLDEALEWWTRAVTSVTGARLPHGLALADYDMPPHPVAQSGATFARPAAEAAEELARWYANLDRALREVQVDEEHATEPRCWPHHFDLGQLILLDPEKGAEAGRSIGIGLSPGDGTIPEPYVYCSPYPSPKDPELPDLDGAGRWHREGFFSAVLAGSDLAAAGAAGAAGAQAARLAAFLESAIAACRRLLR
jgi:hypothetical protein